MLVPFFAQAADSSRIKGVVYIKRASGVCPAMDFQSVESMRVVYAVACVLGLCALGLVVVCLVRRCACTRGLFDPPRAGPCARLSAWLHCSRSPRLHARRTSAFLHQQRLHAAFFDARDRVPVPVFVVDDDSPVSSGVLASPSASVHPSPSASTKDVCGLEAGAPEEAPPAVRPEWTQAALAYLDSGLLASPPNSRADSQTHNDKPSPL